MQGVNRELALVASPSSHQTWRISLGKNGKAGTPLLTVKEPVNVEVYANEASLEDTAPESGSDIQITWAPSGGAKADIELENWVTRDSPPQMVVRAGLRTIRVIWCNPRALIYSAEEHRAEAIDAVVRFAVCAQKIDSLEKQMEALWPQMESFKDLSHSLKRRDQRRQAAVNATTEQATQMTIDILRLQTALEQLDMRVTSTSKRLFAELTLQAALYDRLELIEDPVEFVNDHLELANTRLIEARASRENLMLEALIFIVLLVNLIPLIYK